VAKTIGEVDFLVDFDGRGLPGKARKIGAEAGAEGGREFNKGFSKELSGLSKELRSTMDRDGALAGATFTESMRNAIRQNRQGISDELAGVFGKKSGLSQFIKQTGDVDLALSDLRDKMRELNGEGGLSAEMYDNLNGQLDAFEEKTRVARVEQERSRAAMRGVSLDLIDQIENRKRLDASLDRNANRFRHFSLNAVLGSKEVGTALRPLNNVFDALAAKVDKASSSGDRFNRSFRFNSLPEQLQDVIVIGSLIAALGTDIAVLGSAAGSSIAVLGTGILAAVTGIGVFVAGVRGMTGEIDKIAPAARPAAVALKDMGKRFTEIKQTIQGRMFADMEDSIRGLTDKLLPRLETSFGNVSDGLNRFLRSLSARLTTPKALQDISDLLDGMVPIMEDLFGAAVNLGSGLGSVFLAGLPTAQDFFGTLEGITGEFAAWAATDKGRDRIAEWFDTLERIAPVVGRLLGETGKMLAGLVTDETITKLSSALDGISDLMPAIGGLLDTIGKLDPIGLFVSALTAVADGLAPLKPGFDDVATALNGGLTTAFEDVSKVLDSASKTLSPFFTAIADDLIPALVGEDGLVSALSDLLADDVLPALEPAIDPLANLLVKTAEAATEMVKEFGPLIALFTPAAATAISGVATALALLLTPVEDLNEEFAKPENQKSLSNWLEQWTHGIVTEERLKAIGEGIARGLKGISDTFTAINDWGEDMSTRARDAIDTFGSNTEGMFADFGTNVKNWFNDVFTMEVPEGLANLDETVTTALDTFWTNVGAWFEGVGDDITQWIDDLFDIDSSGIADDINEDVNQALEDFWSGVGDWFTDIGDDLQEWWDDLWNIDTKSSDDWKDDLEDTEVKMAGVDFTAIEEGLASAGTAISDFITSAGETLGGVGTAIGDAFSTVKETVGTWLEGAGETVAGKFEDAKEKVGLIRDDVAAKWSTAKETVGTFLEGAGQAVADKFDTAKDLVGTIRDDVAGKWSDVKTSVGTFLEGAGQTVADKFDDAKTKVSTIRDDVANKWSTVKTTVGTLLTGAGQAVAEKFDDAKTKVGSIRDTVASKWSTVKTTVGGFLTGAGQVVSNAFSGAPGLVGSIKERVSTAWSNVKSRVGGYLSGIGESIGGFFQPAIAAAGRVVSGVVGFFTGLPGRIRAAVSGIGTMLSGLLDFSWIKVKLPSIPSIRVPSVVGGAPTAVGGLFNQPSNRLIGEAGPEAVVPLDRDLNQVDPAVRALSAFAQGKFGEMGSSATQAGKSLVVEDGAIRITTAATDPANVGKSVLDEIVAQLPN
jgi:phage-related protein